MHEANNIHLSASTHATRRFAALTARAFGASIEDTKAMGGWSDSGSFRACYDRAFPRPALLGAAMFNALQPESYFLARDILGEFPPFRLSQ